MWKLQNYLKKIRDEWVLYCIYIDVEEVDI